MKFAVLFFLPWVLPAQLVRADSVIPSTVAASTSPAVVSSSLSGTASSLIGLTPEPPVRGIHLTASAAGSKRYREKLKNMLSETLINAVVVDIKEEEGYVYVPGVKAAERAGAYARDIPDLVEWLASLKKQGVYMVARIVVFKDNKMPRMDPSLGVRNVNGDLWYDRHHITWFDPFNRGAWKYNLLIALEAAKAGFDEIQFDYIRFPTDGNLATMRFARPYSRQEASQALVDFLRQASQLLHPFKTKVSIDVFGLTTSVNTGMGIGQQLRPMANEVDYVCPMVYPSHYARGEYGIPNPNDQPYKTIRLAMRDALKVLGPEGAHKLRPYFQDFSLKGRGIRYGANEVRAQLQAAADLGIMSWTLWNASCRYTLDAIRTPVIPAAVASSAPVTAISTPTISH